VDNPTTTVYAGKNIMSLDYGGERRLFVYRQGCTEDIPSRNLRDAVVASEEMFVRLRNMMGIAPPESKLHVVTEEVPLALVKRVAAIARMGAV